MKNKLFFPIRKIVGILSFANTIFFKNAKFILLLVLFFSSFISFAGTKTSLGTGNWNAGTNWSPSGVPGAGDDVVIAAGHTITLNTNTANVKSITISGMLTIGNNNTNRSVTVSGNIIINAGGTFKTAGDGGNTISIGGIITNNGIFDMSISGATADVSFDGAANQIVSGTGGITDFNNIAINNSGSSSNNIVEINSSNFTAAAGFLTLTKGILKMSGSFTFTNTFFNTANPTINSDEGLWLNNANVTVTGQNGDTQLSGLIRITAGIYNVGVSADWWLYYNSGSTIIIEGGALNVSGAFFGISTSSTITFNQSGGTITVNTVGNSYNVASFEIWASGSSFTMSGGSIVLQRAATAFTDYVNYSTNSTITGGKIQAGNVLTPTSSVFWMNSTPPVFDMEVKATNNPQFQLQNNTTVLHDLIIHGVLDAASKNVDITVGCNWTNNGSFLAGTGKVTFSGNVAQSIGGSASTAFGNLVINKTGASVTLNKSIDISGSCTFSAGIVNSTTTNLMTFADNAVAIGANNGANPSYVNGPVKKIGNDAFIFPVGKSGAGYNYCSISAPASITDAFTAEFMRASAKSLGTISASGLSHVSNCEYWNINRTTGSSPVNVTISWSGSSNCNGAAYVNDLATLTLAHFNGTSWNSHAKSSITGSVSSGSITWNNVSSFSPFALGSTSIGTNPLPVKFTSVKAWPVNNGNKIEWTNATEKDISYYEVERSFNGSVFLTVLTNTARNNFGDRADYSLLDPDISNGTVYYRIKAIEYQGDVVYSSIVKVNRSNNADINVNLYPNPIADRRLNLQLMNIPAGNYNLLVYDLSGRIIFKQNLVTPGGAFSQSVLLPETISKAQYLMQFSGNEIDIRKQFLVQ